MKSLIKKVKIEVRYWLEISTNDNHFKKKETLISQLDLLDFLYQPFNKSIKWHYKKRLGF